MAPKRAPSPQGRGGRPSVGKEKVRAGASSPVALRKGFGANSPIRTRPGSLSDAEEEAGGTPAELTKERVHVWVRVLPSSTAGDSPPEQSVVVVDAEQPELARADGALTCCAVVLDPDFRWGPNH